MAVLSEAEGKTCIQRFTMLWACTNFAADMQTDDKYIYSQATLDFVTVSTEFCKYVEQCGGKSVADFCRVMRGLLPMVYLKMTLLGEVLEVQGWNEHKVTEADYDYIRNVVSGVLGENDSFLDVFVEDFKYSEHPVLCTVSECLADVYQQLRELVEVFREGYDEAMQVALYEVADEFRQQWGQKLLNALRVLHDISMNND